MEETLKEISPGLNGLSLSVIKAAIEVHRGLGPGFLESIYEESLCVELQSRDIPFERQWPVKIHYRDQCVGEHRLDLMVDGSLVVGVKRVIGSKYGADQFKQMDKENPGEEKIV